MNKNKNTNAALKAELKGLENSMRLLTKNKYDEYIKLQNEWSRLDHEISQIEAGFVGSVGGLRGYFGTESATNSYYKNKEEVERKMKLIKNFFELHKNALKVLNQAGNGELKKNKLKTATKRFQNLGLKLEDMGGYSTNVNKIISSAPKKK